MFPPWNHNTMKQGFWIRMDCWMYIHHGNWWLSRVSACSPQIHSTSYNSFCFSSAWIGRALADLFSQKKKKVELPIAQKKLILTAYGKDTLMQIKQYLERNMRIKIGTLVVKQTSSNWRLISVTDGHIFCSRNFSELRVSCQKTHTSPLKKTHTFP